MADDCKLPPTQGSKTPPNVTGSGSQKVSGARDNKNNRKKGGRCGSGAASNKDLKLVVAAVHESMAMSKGADDAKREAARDDPTLGPRLQPSSEGSKDDNNNNDPSDDGPDDGPGPDDEPDTGRPFRTPVPSDFTISRPLLDGTYFSWFFGGIARYGLRAGLLLGAVSAVRTAKSNVEDGFGMLLATARGVLRNYKNLSLGGGRVHYSGLFAQFPEGTLVPASNHAAAIGSDALVMVNFVGETMESSVPVVDPYPVLVATQNFAKQCLSTALSILWKGFQPIILVGGAVGLFHLGMKYGLIPSTYVWHKVKYIEPNTDIVHTDDLRPDATAVGDNKHNLAQYWDVEISAARFKWLCAMFPHWSWVWTKKRMTVSVELLSQLTTCSLTDPFINFEDNLKRIHRVASSTHSVNVDRYLSVELSPVTMNTTLLAGLYFEKAREMLSPVGNFRWAPVPL